MILQTGDRVMVIKNCGKDAKVGDLGEVTNIYSITEEEYPVAVRLDNTKEDTLFKYTELELVQHADPDPRN